MPNEYKPKLGVEKKCVVCGRKFFIPAWMQEGYTYRINERYCCSYTCYSKKFDEQKQWFKGKKEMVCK